MDEKTKKTASSFTCKKETNELLIKNWWCKKLAIRTNLIFLQNDCINCLNNSKIQIGVYIIAGSMYLYKIRFWVRKSFTIYIYIDYEYILVYS